MHGLQQYNCSPTSTKIIQCIREREEPNQTFSGLDTESYFEECASQYPLDPTAGFVLGISNLLFWAGIIIVIVAFNWIVYGWYILIERLQEEALGLSVERNDQE